MTQAAFWIESKYVNMLSNKLELFKNKGNNLYNFRCPICGDSEKNRFKARGYLFATEGSHIYKCHNCGASLGFKGFLKEVDQTLYREFLAETLSQANGSVSSTSLQPDKLRFKTNMSKFAKKRHDKFEPLKDIKKISQLQWDHPAKQYVERRMIPNRMHAKLYYAPKFNKWVNKHWPGKIGEKAKEEPRLVIPFFDQNGYVFGVQGRSFDKKSTLRYMTIMFTDHEKIFGLERLNGARTYYIVEGPLDSLFLSNGIAMAGADLKSKYTTHEKAVFVYDNEPRNAEIIKRMEARIKDEQRLVIWPDNIVEKDINDMVLNGSVDISDIDRILKDRTFSGLHAKLELNKWKKV